MGRRNPRETDGKNLDAERKTRYDKRGAEGERRRKMTKKEKEAKLARDVALIRLSAGISKPGTGRGKAIAQAAMDLNAGREAEILVEFDGLAAPGKSYLTGDVKTMAPVGFLPARFVKSVCEMLCFMSDGKRDAPEKFADGINPTYAVAATRSKAVPIAEAAEEASRRGEALLAFDDFWDAGATAEGLEKAIIEKTGVEVSAKAAMSMAPWCCDSNGSGNGAADTREFYCCGAKTHRVWVIRPALPAVTIRRKRGKED